ncbi:chitobiase/beta-hexosaminidase C-terminal domain-containing protein [bacterium]|nr:chitobiase/beta-hexosaminidase C-terminal domain-containing protein [bacterium]
MRKKCRCLLPLVLTVASLAGCSRGWKPADNPLFSPWARTVDPNKLFPGYPRPLLERAEWLNLNGLWDYAVLDSGEAETGAPDGRILVPFCIESALSGVKRGIIADQRLLYRRSFALPGQWRGRRILIHFEAVDWATTVLINGTAVGEHRGGYDPFTFDITDALTAGGEQEITVLVSDPTDEGEQPRGKQVSHPRGIWYTPVSGIWQTVWLEPVPETRIERIFTEPDIDASAVSVRVEAVKAGAADRIVVAVTRDGNTVTAAAGAPGSRITVPVPNAELWSPDHPFLYGLHVTLERGDEEVDAVRSYFGMRTISIGPDAEGVTRLLLNNEFLFQHGPLDQGYWPGGLLTPPSDAAYRYDLEMIKAYGFNMLRKHVTVESRRFYAMCDSMGILVWQDMPSGDRFIGGRDPDIIRSEASARQFETELRRMIETKYNHPSIVMWVPFNEGWGQYDTERIVDYIRSLDPTRLVNNTSGWADRGAGDVIDMHRYPGPGSPLPEKRRAAVLGEFGGLGWNAKGHMWQDEGWGYDLLTDAEALNERYEDLCAKLLPLIDHPGLSAAVYTQISDIETENNGLMTYDRKVKKVDPETASLAHRGILPPLLQSDMRIFLDRYTAVLAVPGGRRADIRYTLDGSDPGPRSSLYTEPVILGESTLIKTRCYYRDGGVSRVTSYRISKGTPVRAVTPEQTKAGLRVSLYEGGWNTLPDFASLEPAETLTASRVDLTDVTRLKEFGLVFSGFIKVPETGVYRFSLISDDGSRLSLDGREVILNDGIHGMRTRMFDTVLEAGCHPLTVHYFQNQGGLGLTLHVLRPGEDEIEVPAGWYVH